MLKVSPTNYFFGPFLTATGALGAYTAKLIQLVRFGASCLVSLVEVELFPYKMISQLSLLPVKEIPIG